MRRLLFAFVVAVAACGGSHHAPVPAPVEKPPAPVEKAAAKPAHDYPAATRGTVVDHLHGVDVADPYRWLEDDTAADTQAWMKAEDDYARAHLAALPGRAAFAARLGQLLRRDELEVPHRRGSRLFYERKLPDKDKRILYWREGDHGAEHVALDPNSWSTDGSTGVSGWYPSWDGRLLAYNVNLHGADAATMKVIDLTSGKELADAIPGTGYGGASWTPDGKGFYYIYVPDPGEHVVNAERPGLAELRHHRLGDDPTKDVIVHGATHDATTDLGGGVSKDGHWLVASVHHGEVSNDVSFIDTRVPHQAWQPLVAGSAAKFSVFVWKDAFYVLTNDGAPRYHVFRADPKRPARVAWKEIVPAGDATITRMQIIGGHLVLTLLRDAATEVEIRDLDGSHPRALAVPALGDVPEISGLPDADDAYLSYTSFTVPLVVYRASIKSGAVTEWAKVTLPIDTSRFVTDQVHYPSKDGTEVSMFIVHDKEAQPNGKHAVLLGGYGGFAISDPPSFSARAAVWLEQGGVYAWANLRGGSENGEDWHRHGMLAEKQHVFDDFIAAAEYLEKTWTSPARLVISGGSNGGLLVGAVMTQRPELYKAVVCSRPLLDMVRYHRFGWGATWINEYGSADDEKQFPAIYAYSPYHHVAAGTTYPALLMLSSDHDDRVDPLHARKFVAAVQWATATDAPVWLRIEQNAGHHGADVVAAQIEEGADALAFVASEVGLAR